MTARVELLQIPLAMDGAAGLQGRRYSFDNDGPRVLVTAGIHGNEVNGIAAAWQLQERTAAGELNGSISVFPCVNPMAAWGKGRRIPGEDTDLNRLFPGRQNGYMAERIAWELASLAHHYDVLLDVHTTGWCAPHVLLDPTPDRLLERRVVQWAEAAGVPIVLEPDDGSPALQGLSRSWSAYFTQLGKPAITLELPGFLTLSRRQAAEGAELLYKLVTAALGPALAPTQTTSNVYKSFELHGNSMGLFEAAVDVGTRLADRNMVGMIRTVCGEPVEEIRAPAESLLLVLQTGSAVHAGSWLATLALPTTF